jgi:competence protein ComEC
VNVCPFATAALTISLVVVVSYADLKMVIAGDNESPSWKELLNDPTFVTAIKGANVLLASHHGRDAGYSADLFEATGKPKLDPRNLVMQ